LSDGQLPWWILSPGLWTMGIYIVMFILIKLKIIL